MTTGPGVSGYVDIDHASDPEKYVGRLDAVGGSEFWQAVKRRSFQVLELEPGQDVLDIGCGTGNDVLALADLVGPGGSAVGVDSSAIMLDEARRRSASLSAQCRYQQCDATALTLPDACFDACRAERVLQHLDDPGAAVREMARVMRTGARIVLIEPDYGALVLRGADPSVTRRILRLREAHFRSPRVGRQLVPLLRAAGIRAVNASVVINSSTDLSAPAERATVDKYVERALQANVITASEGSAWLDALELAHQRGDYRHAIPVFLVSGRKTE